MDKRKLFGTIIGVAMFAALIAGATFAWLTFTATVVEDTGAYITGARNFVINYTNGNDITSLPILTLTTAAEVASNSSQETSAKASSLTVKAKLHENTSPKGDMKLTLYTTQDTGTFISSGAIRYSVSINGGTPTAPTTLSSTQEDLVLSRTGETDNITHLIDTTTDETITVYFWLDAFTIDNEMMGKQFAASLRASAVQNEN